jgi:hypothetical protein
MVEKLRGPFGKFVDWRQCAAVMQRDISEPTEDFHAVRYENVTGHYYISVLL